MKKVLLLSTIFSVSALFILGIPTAIITNPFFIRMTPVYWYDYVFLILDSMLLGVYFGLLYGKTRKNHCSTEKRAYTGGIVGFLGVGCPVCNKVLLFFFSGSFLLTYFEPIRPYIGLLSVCILLWAFKKSFYVRNRK